jgi:hypothetical protein
MAISLPLVIMACDWPELRGLFRIQFQVSTSQHRALLLSLSDPSAPFIQEDRHSAPLVLRAKVCHDREEKPDTGKVSSLVFLLDSALIFM